MKLYNISEINDALKNKKGYLPISELPNTVTLLAIRSNNLFTNKFDDLLIWIVNGETKYARCTTDAGKYYVENPVSSKGTAILKEGQYEKSFKLGLHKGLYLALVQAKPVVLWRDKDEDQIIDMKETDKGFFGINIHRASSEKESEEVNKWSAGCIVVSNPFKFNELIKDVKGQILDKSNKSMYFTLTLLHENDFTELKNIQTKQ